VFLIDLQAYMLYNQICLGNRMNTGFPADFFSCVWLHMVLLMIIHGDMKVFMWGF